MANWSGRSASLRTLANPYERTRMRHEMRDDVDVKYLA
jgi:hypothetical protein